MNVDYIYLHKAAVLHLWFPFYLFIYLSSFCFLLFLWLFSISFYISFLFYDILYQKHRSERESDSHQNKFAKRPFTRAARMEKSRCNTSDRPRNGPPPAYKCGKYSALRLRQQTPGRVIRSDDFWERGRSPPGFENLRDLAQTGGIPREFAGSGGN